MDHNVNLQAIQQLVTSNQSTDMQGMVALGEDGVTYQLVLQDEQDNTQFVLLQEGDEGSTHATLQPETESSEKNVKEVAIQANDYEIERSGKLPARQRIIPFKFRDYKDPDDVKDEDPDDVEYKPNMDELKLKKPAVNYLYGGRGRGRRKNGRGRPRKTTTVEHNYGTAPVLSKEEQEEQEKIKIKEEETFREAAKVSHRYECTNGDCKDLKFKSYYLYKKHVLENHKGEAILRGKGRPKRGAAEGNKLFTCLVCDKKFSQKCNLKVHMSLHMGAKPYKCDRCAKNFRTPEARNKHIMMHDGLTSPFECPECHKHFSSRLCLQEHMSLHTGEQPYECPKCSKRFRQTSSFYRHTLTHNAEKKYKCTVCAKSFIQMCYLKLHMRSHTGEKPFECKVCKKRFAYPSDLTRHQNVHFGQKKFVCEVCSARFSDPSSRRRHMKEHLGAKPYTCQLCPGAESFKRAGQLKAHLAKKHLNEEVVITRGAGRYNGLQFYFRDNAFNGKEESMDEQQQVGRQVVVNNNQSILSSETQHILQQIHNQISSPDDQSKPVQVAYQIIHDDENQQIVEVQYHRDKAGEENVTDIEQSTANIVVSESMKSAAGKSLLQIQEVDESSQNSNINEDNAHIDTNEAELMTTYTITANKDGNTHRLVKVLKSSNDKQQGNLDPIKGEKIEGNTEYNEANENITHIEVHVTGNEQVTSEILQEQPEFNGIEIPQVQKQVQVYQEVQEQVPEQVQISQDVHGQVHIGQEVQEQMQVPDVHTQVHDQVPINEGQIQTADYIDEQVLMSDNSTEQTSSHVEFVKNTKSNENTNTLAKEQSIPRLFNIEDNLSAITSVYVKAPDFSSQDYYNWLSTFTDVCRSLQLPLDADLFKNISFVHKTLTDVLAAPKGILSNKHNYRILKELAYELYTVINEHHSVVMEGLIE